MAMKRGTFLKSGMAAAATLSLGSSRVLGANDDIRLGQIGIGSFVKIGGKGRGDVRDFQTIPGVRVTALCDCDSDNLGYEVQQFKKRNEPVQAFRDFRDLLDDPEIDAVSITTPNHWHSLMAIMACQAGKDVFVDFGFEGRLEGLVAVAGAKEIGVADEEAFLVVVAVESNYLDLPWTPFTTTVNVC